jgi:hypothetical protein
MPMQAQRGCRTVAPSHSQPATKKRWVITTTLIPLFPGKDTYLLYRRLAEPRARLPPEWFNSRNVQAWTSLYTDCATRQPNVVYIILYWTVGCEHESVYRPTRRSKSLRSLDWDAKKIVLYRCAAIRLQITGLH